MKTSAELASFLRSRINPVHAETLGTESYERRVCAEAIESQIARIAELAARNASLERENATYAGVLEKSTNESDLDTIMNMGVELAEKDVRIAELESKLAKQRPYNGRSMSVQEHDEITEHLAAQNEALIASHNNLRDVILNERNGISENGMTNEQINDVLCEINLAFMSALVPNQSAEILRKRDAKVLLDAAKSLRDLERKAAPVFNSIKVAIAEVERLATTKGISDGH